MPKLWQKSCFGFYCLVANTIIKFFITGVVATIDKNTVLLNSYENCAANRQYEVTPDVGYHVSINQDANQSCPCECTASFISNRNNSWICVAQVGLESHIKHNNAELFIYDKARPGSHLVDIKYTPSSWKEREICAESSQIDFHLKSKNQRHGIDFRKLRLHFSVLDIESKGRTAYFDDTYCATTYKLLNSQVSIYNMPMSHNSVSSDTTLDDLCGISIQMVGVNQTTDRRICFVYIPLYQVNCESNWMFSVSIAGYSTKRDDMVYSFNCSDQESQTKHSWCADKDTNEVTLVFQRDRNVQTLIEHPQMFRFVIRDYNGTAESLMKEWTKYEENSKPQEDILSEGSVLVICVSSIFSITFLMSIILVFLFRNKISLFYKEYRPVRNLSKSSSSSSSSTNSKGRSTNSEEPDMHINKYA